MPAPVILVHDEGDVRRAAMDALREAGYDCVGFADPMTALDAIEDDSRVRVLVTRVDFGEGILNGVALARMLRSKRPGAKAVFVARPGNEHHTEDVGIFVPVPFDPPRLVEAVERALTELDR